MFVCLSVCLFVFVFSITVISTFTCSWKTILPGWRVLLLPLLAIIFFVPILPIIKLLAVLKYGFLLKSTIFGLLYGASEVTLGGL